MRWGKQVLMLNNCCTELTQIISEVLQIQVNISSLTWERKQEEKTKSFWSQILQLARRNCRRTSQRSSAPFLNARPDERRDLGATADISAKPPPCWGARSQNKCWTLLRKALERQREHSTRILSPGLTTVFSSNAACSFCTLVTLR